MGARGQVRKFALKGIGKRDVVTNNCEKVTVAVQGAFDRYNVTHAVTVKDLDLPFQSISERIANHIRFTEGIEIRPYVNAQPQLLIGQDNWKLIVTRELRENRRTGLAISRSLLGWAVHGCARQGPRKQASVNMCQAAQGNQTSQPGETQISNEGEKLDELIRQYFLLDSFGVNENSMTKTERGQAFNILKETTRRTGKRWETGLLWRENYAPQVDSKTTAIRRLISLERKLDREPVYAALYYSEMARIIENGYAVKVSETANRERMWYLPHFGVQNENKPGKVRLVFDAAAKTEGVSLNDQLEAGPDLLQSLPGVVMRFRQSAIAFKADIKDMFLRVQVREDDRGMQRFLWRGRDRKKNPEVYEMTCLIFGAKSSPCSAIYVKDKNASSFSNSMPEASKSIVSNSYMDDYLASRDTIQEAADLIRDVIRINSQANFEMHGWDSNDARVLEAQPEEARARSQKRTPVCDRGERVLGLIWDPQKDDLSFNVGLHKIPDGLLNGLEKPTKRQFLRIIMSVFDPLGFLSPFTVRAKLLMQEVWRSGIGWDDTLRDEEHVGWVSWLKNLRDVNSCSIPRCYTIARTHYEKADLHVFCDASTKAFAAVAYLRFEIGAAPAQVALVAGKTKVAPLKPLSIPRLELQAALLGARLAKTIATELEIKITGRYLWSDSITVIRWIKTEPRARQIFVANRLAEIGEITVCSEWRWVPSSQNPADDATRWSNQNLRAKDRWLIGPEFLRAPEASWPMEKSMDDVEKKAIDGMETRKAYVCVVSSSRINLPLTTRLLGWRGLLVAARRVKATVNRWRAREPPEITIESTKDAEDFWYRDIQSACFEEDLDALKNKKVLKKSSKIAKLTPFVDELGILRANGRVTEITNALFENQPIVLDAKHPATKMLIAEYHRRFYHASSQAVVNELRQKYYIIGLRNALRSIISKCLTCRLRRGKPQSPMMANLPPGRVAYRQRPFSHCGVDYFGPMYVKIGRRREKRWGVLFTCLTTRAIHLELAHSLSTSSAIMALQRLAARRGSPLAIYSDNGKNFRGAGKELRDAIEAIDVEKQKDYALKNNIRWIFNPPDAPHMGGAWERLIRSVKTSLSVILREQVPSEEVLITLLAEVEHSVNSRPLTHVSVDPRDDEALTPNHFLIGTSSGEIKLGRYEAQSLNPKKQWRIAQAFADAFWRRWLREYVPTLVTRKKWHEADTPLKIGDLVLIVDLEAPRNVWKKGIITQIYPGADGEVRVVRVRTSKTEYTRPTRKIIKLLGDNEVQN